MYPTQHWFPTPRSYPTLLSWPPDYSHHHLLCSGSSQSLTRGLGRQSAILTLRPRRSLLFKAAQGVQISCAYGKYVVLAGIGSPGGGSVHGAGAGKGLGRGLHQPCFHLIRSSLGFCCNGKGSRAAEHWRGHAGPAQLVVHRRYCA